MHNQDGCLFQIVYNTYQRRPEFKRIELCDNCKSTLYVYLTHKDMVIIKHMFFFLQNVQHAIAMLVLNTLFSEFLHYNFEYTK